MIYNNLEITPKNDLVFKRLFGAKGNEGILKDLLESILDIEIDSLVLDLNTEMLPDFYDGKQTRIDVRTKLKDGTEINIEIQSDPKKYSDDRCLQHWSKIYSSTIRKGQNYTDAKKTICIWIIDGIVYDEIKDFHSKWKIKNNHNVNANRFDKLEFHILELKKVPNSVKLKPNKKNFWLWFIDHTNKGLVDMACESNDKIREAREQLDKIMADEELWDKIRLQESFELDQNTSLANAKAEGMAEGKHDEKLETAKNMLKLGFDIETIAKVTGLSAEEIEKLK